MTLCPPPQVNPKFVAEPPPDTMDPMPAPTSSAWQLPQPTAAVGGALAMVLSFHEAFDLPRRPLPDTEVDQALADLRVRLLREEVQEFADAAQGGDIVAVADAIADIVYVAYGTAVSYGIDLDAVVREVHRSNMSKLDDAGRPVLRPDGKVLKSARYRPPDVARVLGEQLPLFDPVDGTARGSLNG